MAAVQQGGRGTKSSQLRLYNERLVLQALRRMGEGSKADLGRAAGLTGAAVGKIVSSLVEQGLVLEGGKRHDGQRGQPATLVRINSEGAFGIGVRLDRTFIEVVLTDFDGNKLAHYSHEGFLPPPDQALEIVCRDIDQALELLSGAKRDKLAGIGLAQPFNLSSWLDILDLPPDSFILWEDVDFGVELERATGFPVYVENDTTSAAIAELFYGVGRELDDFLYLFFGPGVGGGLVIDGECMLGASGNAADVGLMPVAPASLPSAPKPKGKWDIMLNRAALNSLVRHLRYHGANVSTVADLPVVLDQFEKGVEEWIEDCVDAVTPAIWSARALLDVPVIVLNSDLGDEFVNRLKVKISESLAANAPEARTPPRVIIGSFGSDAEALGAASLPIFYSFSPRKSLLTNGEE